MRSFKSVLEEAKITPRQMKICEMRFVEDMLNYQIGMALNVSKETLDRDIKLAYAAINRVLEKQ